LEVSSVVRHRLRFLLQEFDLPRGVTVIGRSAECHLTIEDPLVSRKHAEIRIGEQVVIEDLASRNGVRVNGAQLVRPTVLSDGDRIRIGTQELVFYRVDVSVAPREKTTGFLRHCFGCRLPYPQEAMACPHCGETKWVEQDTMSGLAAPADDWNFDLMIDVLRRAVTLGRVDDAERLLRRATLHVESDLADGTPKGAAMDQVRFGALASLAVTVASVGGDLGWATWVVQTYRRLPYVPSGEAVRLLGELSLRFPSELGGPLRSLASRCRDLIPAPSEDEARVLILLGEFTGLVESGPPSTLRPSARIER
jgi:hypothetical protein